MPFAEHEPPGFPGFVSLVGAGPGAPDLLTLRGLRALERAEVILPDALLEPEFQDLFPKGALVVPAGKRSGEHGLSQEAISSLLVDLARRGKRLVRLKGGDPLLFGRGGEEAQALEANGIPFEIIPGVSALQGAAAAAGIPLTHRGLCREVRILEGHGLLQAGTPWRQLAQGGATLAIFMGKGTLAAVARKLLEHGGDPCLPAALVENGGGKGQEVTWGTLALAAQGGMRARTSGPGLVYMGAALQARTHPIHVLPPFSESLRHDPCAAPPVC
jgi:uroporphyrin-III C-methyltransferase